MIIDFSFSGKVSAMLQYVRVAKTGQILNTRNLNYQEVHNKLSTGEYLIPANELIDIKKDTQIDSWKLVP